MRCRSGGSHITQDGSPESFRTWFVRDTNWSRTALPLASGLLAVAPLVRRRLGRGPFLVYLQLPAYMLHQYEEHAHGAFKAYVQRVLAGPETSVTDGTIFWINIAGVWGVDLGALYLARFVNRAFGLIPPYLAVINGLTHTAMALKRREYNPGLWTSLALFIPFGGFSIVSITRKGRLSARHQRRAFGFAVLLHVVVFSVMLRGRQTSE
jgi:hypothetical protein